jgi:dUTP pyrophosphatase
MTFLIKQTNDAKDLPLPSRQTEASAGMDLYANIHEEIHIKKGERFLVPTGIQIALPYGYEAQVRPRSGLAFTYGVTLLNAPGTIDADYRGQVHALLINLGEDDFTVKRGDRVAQMIINKVEMVSFEEAEELPGSERGSGGFGSTGI